jgi:hypothetical protein
MENDLSSGKPELMSTESLLPGWTMVQKATPSSKPSTPAPAISRSMERPMQETKLLQAISYLTDQIAKLSRETEGLKTEVRRLHLAVTKATDIEIRIEADRQKELRDQDKIARSEARRASFQAYQEGINQDAS